MKRLRIVSFLGVTGLAAGILLFMAAPVRATYPGKNGRITFVSNLSGTYQLYTINPDGSDMRQITNLRPRIRYGLPTTLRTANRSFSRTT